MSDRLILALDLSNALECTTFLDSLDSPLRNLKVGPVLFYREGGAFLRHLADRDFQIFVDLKLNDIPNTVAEGVRRLLEYPNVRFLTLHASGGPRMIEAARDAAEKMNSKVELLAVTVLTSLDGHDLQNMGYRSDSVEENVCRLAKLAIDSGASGVVCSAKEVAGVRSTLGEGPSIVVPGIRPTGFDGGDDQRRVATPTEARKNGATHLVVGRPILKAKSPQKTIQEILDEIEGI